MSARWKHSSSIKTRYQLDPPSSPNGHQAYANDFLPDELPGNPGEIDLPAASWEGTSVCSTFDNRRFDHVEWHSIAGSRVPFQVKTRVQFASPATTLILKVDKPGLSATKPIHLPSLHLRTMQTTSAHVTSATNTDTDPRASIGQCSTRSRAARSLRLILDRYAAAASQSAKSA